MEWFFSWLGGFLGGPFARAALDAYKAKLTSENDAERIAADLKGRELAVEQREAELNSQLLILEQGNLLTRWVRPMWAAPFVIWTWKAIVWDKLIMAGAVRTDGLDGMLGTLCITIAGCYFGARAVESAASMFAVALRRR